MNPAVGLSVSVFGDYVTGRAHLGWKIPPLSWYFSFPCVHFEEQKYLAEDIMNLRCHKYSICSIVFFMLALGEFQGESMHSLHMPFYFIFMPQIARIP